MQNQENEVYIRRNSVEFVRYPVALRTRRLTSELSSTSISVLAGGPNSSDCFREREKRWK